MGVMMPWRRTLLGLAVAAVLLPVATVALIPLRETVALPSDLLVFLVLVAAVAAVGGLVPGVVAAVAAVGLLNYYFTRPLHTFAVADAEQVFALVAFVGAAVLVSSLVALAQRRAEQAARATATAESAMLADQTRTALLRAVSHDLRTPLASARAAIAGLRTPGITTTAGRSEELLATAEASLARLSHLVENLLDLSRLEAGALSVFPSGVPVEDAAAVAVREVGSGRVAFRIDVPDEVPEVWADPGLLERILANLVANAARHHLGPDPVLVTARSHGPLVCIDVADRGPGVPERDRAMLFEPFQRRGDRDNTTGLGLGLALSRGLSRAMGGDLVASDTRGGGLTMTVSLPAAPAVAGGIPPGAREYAVEQVERI